MKQILFLIRREFWEHRSLWIAPLAIALIVVLGTALFGQIRVSFSAGDMPGTDFERMMIGLSVPFYVTAGILGVVYLLDCLYADRRDRSVLFWKSLPISDAKTVLVKFAVGLLLLPLGTFLLASLTSLAVALVFALRSALPIAQPVAQPWLFAEWLRLQGLMLYGLVAALLWYAPYAAYLMLASAWARRAVYAWAFIPPVLLALLERMLLGTSFFGGVVQRGFGEIMRLAFNLHRELDLSVGVMFGGERAGGPRGGGAEAAHGHVMLAHPPDPGTLLASAPLWVGLLAAALMLWAAIRLRRYRDDA